AWIPVTERLPEYQQRALLWFVTVDPGNSGITIGERSRFEEGKFWDSSGMYRDWNCISHWMPLPKLDGKVLEDPSPGVGEL
ncbi:hypothetical protein LCGC14_2369220, partial [marine sediment metagenome]